MRRDDGDKGAASEVMSFQISSDEPCNTSCEISGGQGQWSPTWSTRTLQGYTKTTYGGM
jgi:hypothetical protein